MLPYNAQDSPLQQRIIQSKKWRVPRLRNPELNNVHNVFNSTLGTYQLLSKRKTNNFGENMFPGTGIWIWQSQIPHGPFPKYLATKLLPSEETHNEVVLSPQIPQKPKGEEYVQDRTPEALDIGLLCWGEGWDGSHISPPPPGRVSLGWSSSCCLGWCKDLWDVPDPEFTAHRLLPVCRSAGKTHSRSAGIKWGTPHQGGVTWSDYTDRINWRGANHSPGESGAKAEFDSIQQSQAFSNVHCTLTVCQALSFSSMGRCLE